MLGNSGNDKENAFFELCDCWIQILFMDGINAKVTLCRIPFEEFVVDSNLIADGIV